MIERVHGEKIEKTRTTTKIKRVKLNKCGCGIALKQMQWARGGAQKLPVRLALITLD